MLTFIDCIMVFGPVVWSRVFAVIFPWFFCDFHKRLPCFSPFLPWFSTVPSAVWWHFIMYFLAEFTFMEAGQGRVAIYCGWGGRGGGGGVVAIDIWLSVWTEFRELLDESPHERPNGAVPAIPKLLRSIVDHNPNVFLSPSKPKVIGTFHEFELYVW